jgi:ABC-type Na+ efflux pump permease subunit/membrane protease YdiL (CAAX protease family)
MGEPPPSPRPSGLARLARLARKELSEILRDRRTIITLVLMPLLLYPLLSMAFQQFFLAGMAGQAGPQYLYGYPKDRREAAVLSQLLLSVGSRQPLARAAFAASLYGYLKEKSEAAVLAHFLLSVGSHQPLARAAFATGLPAGAGPLPGAWYALAWYSLSDVPAAGPPRFDTGRPGAPRLPKVGFEEVADVVQAVRDGKVDVGIRVHRRRGDSGPPFVWELIYQERNAHARDAAAYLERWALAGAARHLQLELEHIPGAPQFAPVRVVRSPLGEATDRRFTLAALVPLILILMTITGAVYPAIDLTAGERERGTLEILVAAPVPRLALLFAKYVAVVTVAVLTAVVNLVMMTVTVQLSGLGAALFGDAGLTPLLVVQLFGLLLLFAAFFSAVLLALCSFARSFKEAQAYLIPLMLLSLAPGVAGLLPGLTLSGPLVVMPLVNVVLLARDLFDGSAEPAAAVVVVFSTLLYACVAIAVAARVFGAEGVLYNQQTGWGDLFRRPREPRSAASATGALLCLVLLFPAYFVLRWLVGAAGREERLWVQALGTVLLFVLVPLAVAAWGRLRLGEALSLKPGAWAAYPAAVLLGLALVPLVLQGLAALESAGLVLLRAEQLRAAGAAAGPWRDYPLAAVVGAVALIGLAEEVFFRGYLLSAFRTVMRPQVAIVASAVLFGVFHAVSAFDRMLPSTVMGLVLGWVCYRSGSLFPAMILHALYDGLSIYAAYLGSQGGESAFLSWEATAFGVAGAVGGVLLVGLCRPPREPEEGG